VVTVVSCVASDVVVYIHCVPKNYYTILVAITLSVVNGFSKFFHCWKEN